MHAYSLHALVRHQLLGLPAGGATASEATVAEAHEPLERSPRRLSVSAVVEARIQSDSFTYSDEEGPWHHYRLTEVTVHIGTVPLNHDGTFDIRLLGGALPDGSVLSILNHPDMRGWSRVLLFLVDGAWSHDPIAHRHAFRIEAIGGRDVLVDQDGMGVTGLGPRGVAREAQVFEPGTAYEASPPLAQDPTSDGFADLVGSADLIQMVAHAIGESAIGYSGAGFEPHPTHPGADWRRLSAAAEPRDEDINPNPCPEQLRDVAGIECLGGAAAEPGTYTVAEMEECLNGGGK